jgi:hypothetical protein
MEIYMRHKIEGCNMKKLILGFIMIVILSTLLGCEQNTNQTNNSNEVIDFIEPESSDWVNFMKPVREYMYYRTQAVLNNDIDTLWKKYPDLENNIDSKQGVNAEKYEVESLNKDFDFLDANYNIESYERIKVKTINENEAIVLVHGSIVYLRNDFDESGGEYLIKVFLELKDKHWTVVKTDEYTQPEYKEWLNEK